MPTVLRQDGFRVVTYPNDHDPAHFHFIKAEGLIVINIGDENTEPSARESHSMKRQDERKALEIASDNKTELLAAWRLWHGEE